MGLIFVYGSLKRNCFNHSRFGFDRKTKFVKEAGVRGFKMYDLGNYPCIVRTGLDEDVVHGEIFEFTETACAALIKRMEESVHYYEEEITVDGEPVITYVFRRVPTHAILVPSGNWREE